MDHSWTLQAVMQMQKDLGVLGEKIDRMRDDFGDMKADGRDTQTKLVEIQKSIASADGALKVFGRIYALALVVVAALLAWFLKPVAQVPAPVGAVVTPSTLPDVQTKKGAAETTPVG